MSCLHYRHHDLYIEEIRLSDIAHQFGTPCYIYSHTRLIENWYSFAQAFASIPHRICYAVKANSNIALLQVLAKCKSGFDIVSLGELERVLIAGGDPQKIIFSGVGKRDDELEQAIRRHIYCFNIESAAELNRLHALATRMQVQVNISLRVNPDIDPRTHAYISTGLKENKFGIDITEALALCQLLTSMPTLRLIGIACHIGSQITELSPFLLAMDKMLALYAQLKTQHLSMQHIDIGGGLGITYQNEQPPTIAAYAQALVNKIANTGIELIIEPGRAMVGNAGVLLTRIEYLKHTNHKNFAIIDAGMNDLIRPALYYAWQPILPVEQKPGEAKLYDIAGPICESADFIGKERLLNIAANDLLAIDGVGAYGFSMSSNYNSRCRPPEIMVTKANLRLIRRRESIEDLFIHELF